MTALTDTRRQEYEIRRTRELARVAFAGYHRANELKWSGHNLSRLLRATGERPERVEEMWSILARLGMESWCSRSVNRRWPSAAGVFDHGEMWGRAGKPWAVVGHPYDIEARERDALAELGRFNVLAVRVDDYPSYYGFGTHHVRVELVEARRPFTKPRGTPKTRASARLARKAFAEELGPASPERQPVESEDW